MKVNIINKENILIKVSYIIFILVILGCFLLTVKYKLDWLTFISCVSGILYVAFLSDRNILNFIVGFISTTTYIFVAYKAKVYGEVLFYFFFDLPMIIISFIMWKKNVHEDFRVDSKALSKQKSLIIFLISFVSVLLYSFVLKALGGVNVYVDATSIVVSFVATILMALRYREQWFMWIIVYLVSIILWASTFNILMLIMSICCFISSVVGYINWSLSMKNQIS